MIFIQCFSNACNLLIAGATFDNTLYWRTIQKQFLSARTWASVCTSAVLYRGRPWLRRACASYFEWIKGRERCHLLSTVDWAQWRWGYQWELVCVCVLARVVEMGDKWSANEKEQLLQYSWLPNCSLAWPWQPGERLPGVSVQCPSFGTRESHFTLVPVGVALCYGPVTVAFI